MTKSTIVQRLIEEKNITAEEAAILLQEVRYIGGIDPYKNDSGMIPYGEICGCNPKNGGSGICGCTMGNKLVDRK